MRERGTAAIAALMLLAATVVGCSKPMALRKAMETLDLSQESIALMTLKTANHFKPKYQPYVKSIYLYDEGRDKQQIFNVVKPANEVENEFNEYLISMNLLPGTYRFGAVLGQSTGFALILPIIGTFIIPQINHRFEVKQNAIVYVGRVEAVMRERKDENEPKAGPITPLIGQSVTGFGDGTFDITISDNYELDLQMFVEKYPMLAEHSIEKAVPPPPE